MRPCATSGACTCLHDTPPHAAAVTPDRGCGCSLARTTAVSSLRQALCCSNAPAQRGCGRPAAAFEPPAARGTAAASGGALTSALARLLLWELLPPPPPPPLPLGARPCPSLHPCILAGCNAQSAAAEAAGVGPVGAAGGAGGGTAAASAGEGGPAATDGPTPSTAATWPSGRAAGGHPCMPCTMHARGALWSGSPQQFPLWRDATSTPSPSPAPLLPRPLHHRRRHPRAAGLRQGRSARPLRSLRCNSRWRPHHSSRRSCRCRLRRRSSRWRLRRRSLWACSQGPLAQCRCSSGSSSSGSSLRPSTRRWTSGCRSRSACLPSSRCGGAGRETLRQPSAVRCCAGRLCWPRPDPLHR